MQFKEKKDGTMSGELTGRLCRGSMGFGEKGSPLGTSIGSGRRIKGKRRKGQRRGLSV